MIVGLSRSRYISCLVAVAALAGFVAGGCLGYRVGSMLPAGIKTVFVPTLSNQTGEPDVENMATDAVIEEFQKDGKLDISDRDHADTILEVTLTGVDLKPLQYSTSNASEVREYRLMLNASMKLKDRISGKTLVEYSRVSGKSSFELIGDFATVKREAIPAAASDLAKQIVSSVVEAW